MNICLIGYGKMGKMTEAAALGRGHQITCAIDPLAAGHPGGAALGRGHQITCAIDPLAAGHPGGTALLQSFPSSAEDCGSPDVFIEFTRPETAPDNIKAAVALGKPVVCGTTGWYHRMEDVSSAVEKSGTALLWSSNFSLGVNLFYRIAAYAARLADPFAEYDLGGLEIHHRKKADSPSGTAKILMEQVLPVMKRKTRVLWGDPAGADGGTLPEDTVHFASVRNGSVTGIHSLFFDSPADTIEITHTARNREGFASGAVCAAEWLVRETRKGLFTMEDVLKDLLP